MMELLNIIVSTAEIGSFIHTPSSHDPDEFVKERISLSVQLVQTLGQLLGRVKVKLVAIIFDDFFQSLEVSHLWLGVSSENTDRGES